MRHKLLFTCAFVAALLSSGAGARTSGNGEYGDAAAREALVKVGIHYRYGGSSPETGFDCSGLVAHVFQAAWGISVPRSTAEQRSAGRAVKREDLAPGDLVFYNTRNRPFSHVGIYLGDGLFVHAPRRGQRVRLENMDNSYWRARFNGARRLAPPAL
ncbi:MAG TPA: C40 family peptidase [Burkholderiales bacterium]|nr:C40 family peptidase [Burkholderiales bacterium]